MHGNGQIAALLRHCGCAQDGLRLAHCPIALGLGLFFFHHSSRSRTKERRRREEGNGESDEGERGMLVREYEGNYLELLAHEQGKQFLCLLHTENPL